MYSLRFCCSSPMLYTRWNHLSIRNPASLLLLSCSFYSSSWALTKLLLISHRNAIYTLPARVDGLLRWLWPRLHEGTTRLLCGRTASLLLLNFAARSTHLTLDPTTSNHREVQKPEFLDSFPRFEWYQQLFFWVRVLRARRILLLLRWRQVGGSQRCHWNITKRYDCRTFWLFHRRIHRRKLCCGINDFLVIGRSFRGILACRGRGEGRFRRNCSRDPRSRLGRCSVLWGSRRPYWIARVDPKIAHAHLRRLLLGPERVGHWILRKEGPSLCGKEPSRFIMGSLCIGELFRSEHQRPWLHQIRSL